MFDQNLVFARMKLILYSLQFFPYFPIPPLGKSDNAEYHYLYPYLTIKIQLNPMFLKIELNYFLDKSNLWVEECSLLLHYPLNKTAMSDLSLIHI